MGAIDAPVARFTKSIAVSFAGREVADLRKQVLDHGVEIAHDAAYGISGIRQATHVKDATIVILAYGDLGMPRPGMSNQQVNAKASLLALDPAPQETALVLACLSGLNLGGKSLIVMSRAIESPVRASDSILLAITDDAYHRTIGNMIGAPNYPVPANALLAFMQRQKR